LLKNKDKKVFEKDDRKRPYNSIQKTSWEVTEDEIEAYQLKKPRFEDPMKDFIQDK